MFTGTKQRRAREMEEILTEKLNIKTNIKKTKKF